MKHLLTLVTVFAITTLSYSQSPNWWKVDGNSNGSSTTFLGTTNAQPLIFKTNNATRATFSSTGAFQVNSLMGVGNRLLQTDANGNILPFAMGNANEVLYGNGTWGVLPNIPTLFWQQHGTDLYYLNGNVGIGTNTPLVSLDVIGDARISNNLYVGGGVIITEKVNANSEVLTGKMRADSIMLDSTRAVYGYSIFKDKVKLENKLQVGGDALINGNLTANTINTANFNITNTLSSNKITAYRITALPGDSLIRIGDSTIYVNTTYNRIYVAGPIAASSPKGLAIGSGSYSWALNSTAIGLGSEVASTANRAITIGSGTVGTAGGMNLINNIPNSLFVGFNSNIPTLVVTSSSGNGTIGKVGIGTSTPSEKLEITHNDPTGGIVLNKVNTIPNNKSEIKFNKNGNGLFAIGCDLQNNGKQTFFIWDNLSLTAPFFINEQGKVGLGGTIPPVNGSIYKLYVDGGIATRDVKVTANAFPDYVFAKEYYLMPIKELERYITENNHLPGIPSAKEIEKNDGYEIGAMQEKIVEKIEEQALYIIELQKQLDTLKKEINGLKQK